MRLKLHSYDRICLPMKPILENKHFAEMYCALNYHFLTVSGKMRFSLEELLASSGNSTKQGTNAYDNYIKGLKWLEAEGYIAGLSDKITKTVRQDVTMLDSFLAKPAGVWFTNISFELYEKAMTLKNRTAILQVAAILNVKRNGWTVKISKNKLAELTGYSITTILNIVNEMCEAQIVSFKFETEKTEAGYKRYSVFTLSQDYFVPQKPMPASAKALSADEEHLFD